MRRDARERRASDFADGKNAPVLDDARRALADVAEVSVREVPERTRARGYYQGVALRIDATLEDKTFEVADGGFVAWTQKLVGSAKEPCLISGFGMDRLALARMIQR